MKIAAAVAYALSISYSMENDAITIYLKNIHVCLRKIINRVKEYNLWKKKEVALQEQPSKKKEIIRH